jgi:hypothetical protein
MIGFAVGGAFLGLAYFDLPYNVMVMAVCATYVVRRELSQTQPAPAGPAASPQGPARPAAAQMAGMRGP